MDLALAIVAVAETGGRWRPGIGDPTALGWGTVAAYLAGAGLCLAAGRREALAARRRERAFWWILALALLVLGLNKQLDLQSALTEVGRDLLRGLGRPGAKRLVQRSFLAALALGGGLGLIGFGWTFRRSVARHGLALAGLALLLAFVTLRAAMFQRLGAPIPRRSWVLELGGITLIAASAAIRLRASTPPDPRLVQAGG